MQKVIRLQKLQLHVQLHYEMNMKNDFFNI